MPETSGRQPFLIHHLSTVDSTNTYLKGMRDAPEWAVVTADEQTAGRGRHSNQWHSAAGAGLYLSVLLRPGVGMRRAGWLSLLAAVAGAETLFDLGLEGVDIKWPNDLLVGERKIGGILIESETSSSGRLERAIVGMGMNLNHTQFPPPLDRTATSYRIETGRSIEVAAVRIRLLERLACWYQRWRDEGEDAIRDRWLACSSYGRGRAVGVTVAGERIEGITAGLDPEGALLLITPNGTVRPIVTGEVSHLRPVGEAPSS